MDLQGQQKRPLSTQPEDFTMFKRFRNLEGFSGPSSVNDKDILNEQHRTSAVHHSSSRKKVRMLVISSFGNYGLISFNLPKERFFVEDVLGLAGIPFTSHTSIQCVSYFGPYFDYVVTVGIPIHESITEQILIAEKAFEKDQESQVAQSEIQENSVAVADKRQEQEKAGIISTSISKQIIPLKPSPQAVDTERLKTHDPQKSSRMLIILNSGEEILIRFTLPREGCTLQGLLKQVGVSFTAETIIQCVTNPGAPVEYVVTVGEPSYQPSNGVMHTEKEFCKSLTQLELDSRTPESTTSSISSTIGNLQSQETPVCSSCGFKGTDHKCGKRPISPIETNKDLQPPAAATLSTESPVAVSVLQQDSALDSNQHDSGTSLAFRSEVASQYIQNYSQNKNLQSQEKEKSQAPSPTIGLKEVTRNGFSPDVNADSSSTQHQPTYRPLIFGKDNAASNQSYTNLEDSDEIAIVPQSVETNITGSGSSTTSDANKFTTSLKANCTDPSDVVKEAIILPNGAIIPLSELKKNQKQQPHGSQFPVEKCEPVKISRMLILLSSGQQRLLTFTPPLREKSAIQDLLQQIGIPVTSDVSIECVSYPGAYIDYVAVIGKPLQ